MHETCLFITHDPLFESGPGIKPGTFRLADGCSTTELTLLLILIILKSLLLLMDCSFDLVFMCKE